MERGKFYDGKGGRPREVLLDVSAGELHILHGADGSIIRAWDWDDVAVMGAPTASADGVLSHILEAECRLFVNDRIWAFAIAPHLGKPWPLWKILAGLFVISALTGVLLWQSPGARAEAWVILSLFKKGFAALQALAGKYL